MKKVLFLICLVSIFSNQLYSQCGTPSPTTEQYRQVQDEISQIVFQRNDGTTCIPIRAHIVRQSNGSGGVSLEDVNKGIAHLNQYYLSAGIEFYLCGSTPDYLNSDTYYEFEDNEEDAMATAAVEVTNALNMYFVNTITIPGFGNASGYAYFPFNNVISTRVVMDNSYVADGNTMIHELGHWFSLFHTHEGTESGSGSANAENVARPPSGNANCSDHGDLICDTPADPRYSNTNFSFGTCSYIGNAVDANGALYEPDTDNVMSYYPDQCQNPFVISPGQYTRIGQGYITRQGHNQYSLNCPATNVSNPSNLTAIINETGVLLDWDDNSSNEMGFLIERSSTSATAGFSSYLDFGTGPNQSTYTDQSELPTNTTYWYRVKASNDNCDHYSNVVAITTALYCSAGADQCDEFISNVSVGSINNSSACSAGSYHDYSAISTTMNIGQSYPISITNGPPVYTGDQCGIWVDWNQDGDFDDTSETITVSGGISIFTGTITPPAGALSGETKMRVRITYTGTLSPCGDVQYGEVEDYTLNVLASDPGTIQFDPTAYTVTENGTSVTLSVTRTGGSSGASSVDVSTANNSASAGLDYTALSTTLNWADGNSDTQTVEVFVNEDLVVEADELFSVSLTNVTNSTLADANATVTIQDSPIPSSIQFDSITLGFYEGGTHTISVSRTGNSTGAASVTVSANNGSATSGIDYNLITTELNWADGEMGNKEISITVTEDDLEEGTEDFTLVLSNPFNATLGSLFEYSLDITDFTYLSIHAFLEGPFEASTQLMNDNLRSGGDLPLEEPFTELGFTHSFTGGGETTTPSALAIIGNDAIVDWVFIEIYAVGLPDNAYLSISALIQRDGDIVDVDGVSPLKFPSSWDYYVVVRHRNHFGVKSATTLPGTYISSLDFADPTTPVYGTNAMNNNSGTMVLIAGDCNGDGQINPIDKNDYWRLQNGNPYNYINSSADLNMDGAINPIDKNDYWRLNNSKIEQLD